VCIPIAPLSNSSRRPEARPYFDGSKDPNGRLIFAPDQSADLVRLQFAAIDPHDSLMVESATGGSGSFQPTIHGVPGDLLDSGGRRLVHTLDAESGNLIERSSTMRESMIDSAAVLAESLASTLASESAVLSPAGLVESKTNNYGQRGIGSCQAFLIWAAETLHGFEPVYVRTGDPKLGLKPYHMNGIQETQQQLFAEAPHF